MVAKFTDADDALLEELGVEVETAKGAGRTAREERVIAGFEEIQRFFDKAGHAPRHGEGNDIFERLYAVRLDRLRELEDCRAMLTPLDHQGLLSGQRVRIAANREELDDDALLAELGVEPGGDITELKHVRPFVEKQAAEEIANRTPCADFAKFKPLFEKVQQDLNSGVRTTRRYVSDVGFQKAEIKQGEYFILGGQTAYVAEVGEHFRAPNGEFDARLRVIYSNGTESNLLLRSLQRALYKDEAGRRISNPTAGPLFADKADDEDMASGTIYVLRSKSEHPTVVAHREVLHKIGVTGGDIKRRLANAKLDPTFLMADVEVVATYELFNINRSKLENIIHRFFEPARLDIEIKDRFGQPVVPREWFLVPRFVIDQVVEKIKDGTIGNYRYDVESAGLQLFSSEATAD